MSGSAENMAHGASEKSSRHEVVVNLATANRMLSLLRPVIDDLLSGQKHLAELQPEQDRLDRQRRSLSWPERARRYQLREEVTAIEQDLLDTLAELEVLGVELIDPDEGRVGIPTLVNDRAAFFSWRPGEETVRFWHFAGEVSRRPIPPSWHKQADIQLMGKI